MVELGGIEPPSERATAGAFYRFRNRLIFVSDKARSKPSSPLIQRNNELSLWQPSNHTHACRLPRAISGMSKVNRDN